MPAPLALARTELSNRLRERRTDIEQALLTRATAVSDPSEAADPEYLDGLRAAVRAALDYGLAGIEHGEERSPPIPTALLGQARLAARNGVSLDTVLRRYFAGYTLLGDFLIEEAQAEGVQGPALKRLLKAQATVFDRLVAAVTAEHAREVQSHASGTEERRAERIRQLLEGELIDTTELEYDFSGHHLGAIATGPEAAQGLRALASALDRRLLLVRRSEAAVWAWLGGRRPLDAAGLEPAIDAIFSRRVSMALGEPAQGLAGWRLTHRQARAALPIALRRSESAVRYADVALLASMLRDDLLVTSLRGWYLAPLTNGVDEGATLCETLRAYFASDRNTTSTAAALGVTRQTINNRLRAIEERIGASVSSRTAELEAALELDRLDAQSQTVT